MLSVFVASALWVVAILGFGDLVARRVAPRAGPGSIGLLGYFVLASTGTVLHFFVPLSPPVAGAMLLIGVALFASRRRVLLRGSTPRLLGALTVLLAVLSLLSDFPWRHFDMGLYWLQAVQWTTEFPQIPGLATLHDRLGINSSWFTVAAMLEHPLATGKSAFLATTTLLFFAGWVAVEGLVDVLEGRRDLGPVLAAWSALLVFECLGQLGGHSPDAAGAILAFAAFVELARAMRGPEEFQGRIGAAVLLAALSSTVKVSYGVAFGAVVLITVTHRNWIDRRTWIPVSAATSFLFTSWIGNGLVLSGCPLFPSTLGCLPVSWATPLDDARNIAASIRSWARAPGRRPSDVFENWDWLPDWASQVSEMRSIQALAAILVSSVVALVAMRVAWGPRGVSRQALALWLASLAGAAFWFVMAPAPRFAWAYLFGVALIPAAEATTKALARQAGHIPSAAMAAAMIAGGLWILAGSVAWVRVAPPDEYSLASWPPMPTVPSREHETRAGTRLRVPVGTQQCWSNPLPCTPYFDPGFAWEEGIMRTSTPRRMTVR